MVDPAGLEPARVSLQTRCTATRALGPESRWVESNDRRRTPRGLQPRSSNQQRSPGRDRSVWRRRIDVPPIPNLAYYLVVNVRGFFAGLGKRAKLRPAGVAGVEPPSAGLEPAVRSAGLHPFECSLFSCPSSPEIQ